MKFAHIADTHIRNLKRHKEYRHVFADLYEKIKEHNVDYIIHCGDIAHTKTQLSPEYFDLAQSFLKSLADIAPTYVIPGNHDGNLRNSTRQDAITPIVNALAHPNLFYLKESQEVHLNDKFCLNSLSMFDENNWVTPTNKKKINIALYHGLIDGSSTDIGFRFNHGDHKIGIFRKFDFAFLGDIHKTDQMLDDKGKIRYCGSTIQQNFGETNDKGFLVWDIKDKNDFTCQHVPIMPFCPFITIELDSNGKFDDNLPIPSGARIRLSTKHRISLDQIKKAKEHVSIKWNPESISINCSAGTLNNKLEEFDDDDFNKDDMRDISIQEELIEEYLKEYNVSKPVMEKIFEINRRLNAAASSDEEVKRNVKWNLKSFSWDNLFNYGEGNSLDFENMTGIVGIFGKNFSGKSSIIDSLLYTIYNSTSKKNRKNLNIINELKEFGQGTVEMGIDTENFSVFRKSEKYKKNLKGNSTLEARTDVDFTKKKGKKKISLNGTTRNKTDEEIKKYFGTIDDFLLTSMSSQLEALSYIGEGSTKRKEILAKFLDLTFFDKKFKLAKEESAELKVALKGVENLKFNRKEMRLNTALNKSREKVDELKKVDTTLSDEISASSIEASRLDLMIEQIPADIIDASNEKNKMKSLNREKEILVAKNKKLTSDLAECEDLESKIEKFLETFDIDDWRSKKEAIEGQKHEFTMLLSEIEKKEEKLETEKRKVSLLKEVPCGSEFSHCKFIKDAYAALNGEKKIKEDITSTRSKQEKIISEIQKSKPDQVEEYIKKYDAVIEKKNKNTREIYDHRLNIQENKTKIEKCDRSISDCETLLKEYETNKELIDNKEKLLAEREVITQLMNDKKKAKDKCHETLSEKYRECGSLEQELKELQNKKEEIEKMSEQYSSYDLYMRCMHSNGIAYEIIKRKLPYINLEIAKILSNVVEFEVFFEAQESKLDIFIRHPESSPRPIELGSGAEKTIAAMAIRLALLSVSQLPKGDIFILDEPGTALDEENMNGFIQMLEMVKDQFKVVLLISHLDSLKDVVDSQIFIGQKEKFAFVEQ